MKVAIEGKVFVQAGGVFVRHRLSAEVNHVSALGAVLAETLTKALGGDLALLRSGPSRMPIATMIIDFSALVDGQESLSGQIREASANSLHTDGSLPRPHAMSQKTATAPAAAPTPSRN